ncbi:hypothetical protein [Streptomyces sp. NPDC020917]|uniref:hypothetical protein n=1 Tax=Streptomyces sp. NPDC020917 TaxID=3365102 RepID=UPI0037ABD54C
MGAKGGDVPVTGPLEIRTRKLRTILLPMVWMVPTYVLMMRHGGWDRALGGVVLALFGLAVVTTVATHWRLRRQGCVLRIDDSGITVVGKRTVGWDEIRVVRVVRRSAVTAVVPVPREGVELPMLDLSLFRLRTAGRAARTARRWGGPLVLLPKALDADEVRIAAAVRQFGHGVPVVDAPDRATSLPGTG